jgi:hypothetical protein
MIRPYNEGIGGKLGLAIGWKLYEIGTPIEEQLKMADQKMYHDKIVFNGSTGPSFPPKSQNRQHDFQNAKPISDVRG